MQEVHEPQLSVVAPGVERIELPTPFAVGPVNVYLVDGEPLTLVDAGPNWDEALATLEQRLAARGRKLEDIGLLLLTHQHFDHVGLAATIKERSGAEVAALEPLARFLAAGPRAWEAETDYQADVMALNGVPA